jgi:hypothetical protein
MRRSTSGPHMPGGVKAEPLQQMDASALLAYDVHQRQWCRSQILLKEAWTEMHVELHQERFTGVLEAVNLAGLDHEDVPGGGFELLTVDDPRSSVFLNELHFVVWMAMRSGSSGRAGHRRKPTAWRTCVDQPTSERLRLGVRDDFRNSFIRHDVAKLVGVGGGDLDHPVDHLLRVEVPVGASRNASKALRRSARLVTCLASSSQRNAVSAIVSL